MSSSKKGLSGKCLSEFVNWLVFSTQVCELLPPSLWFNFPPLPLLLTRIHITQCVRGGGMVFWASDR